MPALSEDVDTYAKTALNGSSSASCKVLGIPWDRATDCFTFTFSEVFATAPVDNVSKRQVLSTSSRLYDPLGIMAPVTIVLKTFFQQLCQSKVSWDEPLEGEVLGSWCALVKVLAEMSSISITPFYESRPFLSHETPPPSDNEVQQPPADNDDAPQQPPSANSAVPAGAVPTVTPARPRRTAAAAADAARKRLVRHGDL